MTYRKFMDVWIAHRIFGLPLRMIFLHSWHRVHGFVILMGATLIATGYLISSRFLQAMGAGIVLHPLICLFLFPVLTMLFLGLDKIFDRDIEDKDAVPAANTNLGQGHDKVGQAPEHTSAVSRRKFSDICRHPRCGRPRTRFSVFCEKHHAKQLKRADAQSVRLSYRNRLLLLFGPIWLNVLRIGLPALASSLFPVGLQLISILVLIIVASSALGWHWSHRAVSESNCPVPIVFIPGFHFGFMILSVSAVIGFSVMGIVLTLR